MYCDYWNLTKPPFDNVPDPSMYAQCHTSMENVIAETIFAIKEGNEAFAVIIGAAGLGKTLSLRIIIDALEQDRYKSVLITNPSLSFSQLMREIIGQITGVACEDTRKADLLETFNHLLLHSMDEGRKIVIFIDEANALSPANLENLRLLTNMQDDQRNLFTLVLAGQPELAQRLEHPKRANLFQRIGTYGRIDKLPSPEALKGYMETRLTLAGATRKIFKNETIPVIWEYSENGVPRLINKICKLSLKACETNGFDFISADMVSQIAGRFLKLSSAAIQMRKPRSRPDAEAPPELSPSLDMDHLAEIAASFDENPSLAPEPKTNGNVIPFRIPPEVTPQTAPAYKPDDDDVSESVKAIEAFEVFDSAAVPAILSIEPEETQPEEMLSVAVNETENIAPHDAHVAPPAEKKPIPEKAIPKPLETPPQEDPDSDEVVIAGHKIILGIPRDILKQVKSFNRDNAYKSAGFWAAQIIRKNPQLTESPDVDPVSIWNEIKDTILKKISL